MKKAVLLFFIVIVLFISSCTSQQNINQLVQNLPLVQSFLQQYPNANIRTVYWNKNVVSSNIQQIRASCGPQMQVTDYWKVDITDPTNNIALILYLDANTNQLLCAISTRTTPSQTITNQTTLTTTNTTQFSTNITQNTTQLTANLTTNITQQINTSTNYTTNTTQLPTNTTQFPTNITQQINTSTNYTTNITSNKTI